MSRFHHRQRRGVRPTALPRNTVLEGDCIAVMGQLPRACVDLVLTDPPYLVNYRDRAGRSIANDRDSAWVAPAFERIAWLMTDEAFLVSFYGWPAVDTFMAAWRSAGLHPVGHLVFPKRYGSSRGIFESRHEQAYVLAKRPRPRTVRSIPDVLPWSYTGNTLHPTQKPLTALRPIVEALTRPGQLVLDPFCGSGSSLAAAQELGRDWLGIELDQAHAATARARMQAL